MAFVRDSVGVASADGREFAVSVNCAAQKPNADLRSCRRLDRLRASSIGPLSMAICSADDLKEEPSYIRLIRPLLRKPM